MNLLFVIDSLGSGGAQRQMVALAVGLVGRGHTVEFFTYHPEYQHFADQLHAANVKIHSTSKSSAGPIAVFRSLRALITTGEFDVTLAFMNMPSLYCELVGLGHRYRLVASERFAYPERLSVRQRCRTQLHRLAGFLTVNSHHQHSRMLREFPWMKDRIQVVYNGVDLQRFHPSEPTEGSVRSLLALGTVIPRKNVERLVKALAQCSPTVRNALRIRWAGKDGTSQIDIAYAEKVRALVQEYGLEGSWEWLGERKDVPSLLNQHHGLVHPSFVEGVPNAICEGLAGGLPILASRTGDHPYLVEEGQNGLLFDPESKDELTAALTRFAELPLDDLRALGRRSRSLAEQLFAMDRYVSAYEQILEKMAGSR